jgi:flagellar hook-associated protein 2
VINQIRLGGIASGLDTDKIVKDLMKVERQPLDRLKRQKIYEEWKRDSYREMNSMLLEFQKFLDNLRLASNLDKKKVVSDNEATVAVKMNGKPALSNYTVNVIKLAEPATPASAEFTMDASIPNSTTQIGDNFTFEVNSVSISVTSTDTINSVVQKINSAGAGVKATYFNNKLVMTKEDGSTFDVTVTSGDGSKLGMGTTGTTTTSSSGQPGSQGIVEINGVTHTVSSNTFVYDGIEITLKQTTAQPVSLSVKTDDDAVFNQIKDFVTKYNELIDKVNAKLNEKRNRDYQPLLDEEKEELPEKTAEKLEQMAKSGILQRDPILSSCLDALRTALTIPLQGADSAFDTLSEIGITGAPNSKYAYLDKGKLYIDEAKLRKAINENGDKVIQLFSQYSSSKSFNETGFAQRMYEELDKTMKLVTDRAGNTTIPIDNSVIGKNIERLNDDIKTWEDRLKAIEDRYWKKFSAMEKALAQYNSQSTWFANLMGGQQQ